MKHGRNAFVSKKTVLSLDVQLSATLYLAEGSRLFFDAARSRLNLLLRVSDTSIRPSYPENPGCCPATCRGSHQRKGRRYQLLGHNTTPQTWPGTSQTLLVSMGYTVCSMYLDVVVCTFNAQY